jgi:hypothetical protein
VSKKLYVMFLIRPKDYKKVTRSVWRVCNTVHGHTHTHTRTHTYTHTRTHTYTHTHLMSGGRLTRLINHICWRQ